ncbi:MAG TPA: glycosyltransferase family 4 protein [Candidatus Acidoferrum sp.]|nr:glycosyltransferase family 4 protein [Candidatus Acidoferrum sp.]
MRILFVDLDREWRGGQSQALLTVTGLRACGHDAQLMAVRDSPLARRAEAAGVPVHAIGTMARRVVAALLLHRVLSQQRYDLLHANEPHALTAAWLAGSQKKAPLVISRRVAYRLGQNFVAKRRYEIAQRIVAISRFVAKSVLDSGVPAEKVEIVYEGVEVPPPVTPEARQRARLRWGVSETEKLIGCVGYLLPEKGQELAVRAVSTVRAKIPGARLLLAGDGPCRTGLESLARQQGLQDAVIFAGFLEDVTQVYAALDVFVFPSLAEPLGTSLLAAMACGLPVVAVASGGVPEYVEDGVTGLLAAHPDAELISGGILRLFGDELFRIRLGREARGEIEERFSARRMVKNTIRVYEDVLKKRQIA